MPPNRPMYSSSSLSGRLWCDGADMTLPYEQRHYGFNHYQMALQAAQGGMGVAMGREVLVRSLLEQGVLVAVGGPGGGSRA